MSLAAAPIAASALLGLIIGSFLNVVIARVPEGLSVVRPGSRCPACGTPIAARDNVPLLSWFLLRGRARCCGVRIAVRYPVVEALTGVLFALTCGFVARLAEGRPGAWWMLPALLYLAALSVALAAIDLDTFRLPFSLVAPAYPVAAGLLGAASLAGRDGASAVRMLAGGALLWGLYRLLHLVYPAGMGYGDVRLSGVLGLYLGWLGWAPLVVGAFCGFLVGGVGGLALVITGRTKLRGSIPYGPYLLTGAWLGVLVGEPVATAYLHGMGLR
jgi:leader peptidase (prepilin peptidase)/N-methyltransferase